MSKYKLDKSAQVVENQNYTMTQKEVCERLNQQDKRIKELQEELSSVYDVTNESLRFARDSLQKLVNENQQLKQQLHDLPKKIIDEIEKNTQLQSFDYGERYCEEEASNDWAIDLEDLKEILDTILKKYGGER